MRAWWCVILLVGSGCAAHAAHAAEEVDCRAELLSAMHAEPKGSRPGPKELVPEDLIRLVDFGKNSPSNDEDIISASPDKKSLAVVIRRAVPERNQYCSGLAIVRLDGSTRLIDSGRGALFYKYPNLIGKANFPTGIAKVITPRWSPDGKSIAYLKATPQGSRIWLSRLDGRGNVLIPSFGADILDFHFSQDGRSILFRTDAIQSQLAEVQAEGLSGFHFDDRFSPIASSRPFLRAPLPQSVKVVDLTSGAVHAASGPEADLLSGLSSAKSVGGWRPATERGPDGYRQLVADGSDGRARCRDPLCSRVLGTPWSTAEGAIRYMRREGWGGSLTSIYEWKVGSESPVKRYTTEDLLLDCLDLSNRTICVREASPSPRHIAEIDLDGSTAKILFDPNPNFAHFRLGKVQRRHWENKLGIECFGDLVFPAGYREGRSYPLIIVQYTSRGFLRGGTGDEFPVQIFASLGYFVLNIERPESPFANRPDLSALQRQRLEIRDFAERKSILSAIEIPVRQLIAEGAVNPNEIGITGLSDGSTTVQFAILNSDLFSAASATGCCWEPSQSWTLGPSIQKSYADVGWPRFSDRASAFWSEISLAKNAEDLRVPLLIQAADDEYLGSLESYNALTEANAPVDLYVYPDEHHVKWQAAHRLNVYRRNLDWFEYWLRGKKPVYAPDAENEAARWDELRVRRQTMPGSIRGAK